MNNSPHELRQRLESAGIAYQLRQDRAGGASIDVAVPGERWEIDILDDGTVEIEVFKSDGTIFGESNLSELFERFSD